jgi:ferric-dicitrate binding protein FerR (iron transport regulator)
MSQAAGWIAALACAENFSSVLPGLNAWLREKPSHRAAFAEAQRAWRLAKHFLRAGEPDAGRAEVQAFFDALEEERCRSPRDFADP